MCWTHSPSARSDAPVPVGLAGGAAAGCVAHVPRARSACFGLAEDARAQVHGTWSATAHLKPDSAPAGLTAGMEGDAVGGGRQARAPGGAEPLALARRVKVPQPAAPTGARSSVSEWVGQVQLQELEGPGGAAGEAGAEMVPRAGAASTPPRPAKGAAARAAGRVEAGEAGEAARRPPLEPFPRGAARREGSGASLDERPRSPRSEPPPPPSY